MMGLMRRWLLVLLCMAVCGTALAADGDTTLFASGPNGYNENGAEGAVALGDTLYIVTWEDLFAYKLGDAEPKPVCKVRDEYIQPEVEATPAPLESIGGVAAEEQAPQWPENFGIPFGYQDKLYLVGNDSGKLRVLEDGKLADTDLKIDRPSGMPSDYGINNALNAIFESDGKLYVLARVDMNNWDAPQELWLVDPATGGHSVLQTEFPVNGVTPYKPGQLLCWTQPAWGTLGANAANEDYAPQLFAIDAATGKTVEPPAKMVMPTSWYGPAALAYDAERGKILYVTANKLMATDKIGGEPELLSYFAAEMYNPRGAASLLAGTHMVIPSWEGVFLRNIAAGPASVRPLRIANSWMGNSASAFMRDNPDIPLDMVELADLSEETLAQRIGSGDAGFDILRLWDIDSANGLIEKGFALDLSQSEKLKAAAARMYPQLREGLGADGKLMAFPSNVYPSLWRYNKEKFDEFGLVFPETMADYIDLMIQWEDGLKDEHPDVALVDGSSQYSESIKSRMFSIATAYYAQEFSVPGEPLRVNTPEFREILEKVDQLPGEYAEDQPTDSNYDYKPSLIFTDGTLENWDSESGATTYAPMPSIKRGETPVMNISYGVYLVNPNSPNVDLAIRYLEYLTDHGEPADMICMYPDYNEPVADPWEQESLKNAEEELARLQKETVTEENRRDHEEQIKGSERWRDDCLKRLWRISPETIAQYRELAKNMVMDKGTSLYSGKSGEQVYELYNRYTGGQIGLEPFIKELDQKLQMIFLEQQ